MTFARGPLAFIVNPAAGGGKAAKVWERVAAALTRQQVPHTSFLTAGPGDASQLAATAAGEHAGVVAVGGDGTLHEIINGLAMPARVPLGLIPCGTGNDFARSAALPRRPEEALANILAGRITTYDLGRVGDRRFINVAGVGFDAAVAARVNTYRYWKQGAVPYVWAALNELRHRSCVPVEIRLDDAPTRSALLFMAAVGNGNQYAGGMQICPGARPDDGILHVCLIEDISRLEVLSLMPRVFSGRHVSHPGVSIVPARSLAIIGPPDVHLHADGELIGHLPASFSITPGALPFFAPNGQAPAGR